MHSELWRVILHLLQGICHRATGTLFIAFTSDLPLLRAQPSARPLHLGRRIKEMPSRCYCCRDSRPRPFGGGGIQIDGTFSVLSFILCWLLGARPLPLPAVPGCPSWGLGSSLLREQAPGWSPQNVSDASAASRPKEASGVEWEKPLMTRD